MRWPWSRKDPQLKNEAEYTPVDTMFASLFSPGGVVDLSGILLNERSALGLSAMYRAVSIISGQLAGLPMGTKDVRPDGTLAPVESVFDNPDGPDGQTVFEWKETMVANAVIHGRAYALIGRQAAGGVGRLPAVHPLCVTTQEPTQADYQKAERGEATLPVGGLWHYVAMADGKTIKLDGKDVLYVPGLSLDGKTPTGLLNLAGASLRTSIAADRAAGKAFSDGALIAGLATPEGEEDISEDVPEILRQIKLATSGVENAGRIALLSRRLKFTPWTMTAEQAQFLQSRQFQIEEIARWTGVPPHLLMQTSKQSSWGMGITEQDRALGKTVLAPWASRFEERLSRLLASRRIVKFDFRELERPAPETEQNMVINLVNSGIITPNEGRKRLGWETIAGGDVLRNGQDMSAGVTE